MEDAGEVDPEDAIPLLGRNLVRVPFREDPGNVAEPVQPPAGLGRVTAVGTTAAVGATGAYAVLASSELRRTSQRMVTAR